ncbi:hypothetical protein SFRURICE_014727 [Spodoptera frugiperda]|nr:hypothetical protein SFRURICE_014727 [Spodoptera frugiperda]
MKRCPTLGFYPVSCVCLKIYKFTNTSHLNPKLLPIYLSSKSHKQLLRAGPATRCSAAGCLATAPIAGTFERISKYNIKSVCLLVSPRELRVKLFARSKV